MTIHDVLAGYVRILNTHGPDSPEACDYEREHADLDGFDVLAALARWVKRNMPGEFPATLPPAVGMDAGDVRERLRAVAAMIRRAEGEEK